MSCEPTPVPIIRTVYDEDVNESLIQSLRDRIVSIRRELNAISASYNSIYTEIEQISKEFNALLEQQTNADDLVNAVASIRQRISHYRDNAKSEIQSIIDGFVHEMEIKLTQNGTKYTSRCGSFAKRILFDGNPACSMRFFTKGRQVYSFDAKTTETVFHDSIYFDLIETDGLCPSFSLYEPKSLIV